MLAVAGAADLTAFMIGKTATLALRAALPTGWISASIA